MISSLNEWPNDEVRQRVYMERKIRDEDKEQDRKWDEKKRESDKGAGHKSRKEPRPVGDTEKLKERYP